MRLPRVALERAARGAEDIRAGSAQGFRPGAQRRISVGHRDVNQQLDGAATTTGEGARCPHPRAQQHAPESSPNRQDFRKARHRHPRQNTVAHPHRCAERRRLAAASAARATAAGVELSILQLTKVFGRAVSLAAFYAAVTFACHDVSGRGAASLPARHGSPSTQVYGSAAYPVSSRTAGTSAGHSRRPSY